MDSKSSFQHSLSTDNLTLVTLDDFVRTYSVGRNTYDSYYAAERLVGTEGISISGAASQLGIPKGTVKKWFGKNGSKPPVVKAVEHLETAGMLPLHLSAERFPAFNRLAAYINWTGHLRHKSEYAKYDGVISGKSIADLFKQIQDDLTAVFEIESRIKMVSPSGTILVLGKGFAPYARLLESIGVQSGGEYGIRAGSKPSLHRGTFNYERPAGYISDLVDLLEKDKIEQRDLLLQLVRDWVRVLFTTKSSYHNSPICVYLHSFLTLEDAHAYEQEINRIIETASPWLGQNMVYFSNGSGQNKKKSAQFRTGFRINKKELEKNEQELYLACFVPVRINNQI